MHRSPIDNVHWDGPYQSSMSRDLFTVHSTSFEWVKGHAAHADNIRCDELATAEAKRFAGLAIAEAGLRGI